MMTSNVNDTVEMASVPSLAPGNDSDLANLMRQIRICRSALGAILDELEAGERSAETLASLATCITGVTGEIEELWQAAKLAE
jgi:hypothetical protein